MVRLSDFSSTIRESVMNQLERHKEIDLIGFEFGLKLLGIEERLDCIDQSGCLDSIKDEAQRRIMRETWDRIKQWDDAMSSIYWEIKSLG